MNTAVAPARTPLRAYVTPQPPSWAYSGATQYSIDTETLNK